MRRFLLTFLCMLLIAPLGLAQTTKPSKVMRAKKLGESRPLRDLAKEYKPAQLRAGGDHEVQNRPSRHYQEDAASVATAVDPVWQSKPGARSAAAPITVIEGLSSDDNSAAFGFRIMPPDPNSDVGPNDVVEMDNLLYRVWDKSGNPRIAPIPNDVIWDGAGGNCEFNNDGDPIVFYDHLNDRWVLSQFVFSVAQCFAVSQTGDPLGVYNLYELSTPGNDYPKMGNGEDAYYLTIRNFNIGFNMDGYALDGAAMRNGDPSPTAIFFSISALFGSAEGVLPSDLDGGTPSNIPGGVFLGHDDPGDQLYAIEMIPDFNDPPSSVITGPQFIPVAPYSSAFAGGFFGTSIPQPGTTQDLDVLSPFTMFRMQMRDFGTHRTLIVTHTVDVGDFNDHAGMRWYELRDTGGGWTVFQQGTYAPDAEHRWMGNAAMNAAGDIGLGFSLSSGSTFPSVHYTGRSASDPLGQMTLAEGVIRAGTGSQLGGSRWGDYTSMSVDPTDDATFWYTGEYVQQTGSFEWNTAIGSFQVTPAGPTPPTITSTPNLDGFVGQPYAYDADNTVDVTGTAPITFSFTGPTGFSVDANTGVVTWTPTAGQVGANAVSITATNSEGSDTQNFTVTVVEPPPFAARINAGGADYTDTNGDLFEADQAYTAGSFGFVGGVTNTFGNAIGGTTDDVLYQSLRRPGTASSVTYRFDVPASGSYDVTLHMTAPGVGTGNFIMDVLAEGGLVFDDLDINTQSGGTYQALVVSFTASVTDGTLDLDFVTVNRQALIGAIAVEESSGPPTPQDISVSPLVLDFGQVETGQTADLVTTITNDGGTVLNVTGLTLSGGDFSLVSPPGTPFQVAANGGSVALTVRFGPGSTGAQSETLDIDSDDPDEATVTVTLDGEGTDPPAGEEFRINAGGADYTDTNGDLFEADQAYTAGSFGFVGGTSSSFPNPIGGTTDDLLYQSLRRSGESSSFSYQFDVSSSATFDVTLYLTAPAIGPGSFVLDVVAEGATVLNDLDVNAASGGTYQALTQTFSVSVTDGTLNLDFVDVNKQAIVSAIAVVEQTAAPELAKRGTQAADTPAGLPEVFTLYQNHPNPFNPETRIRYALPEGTALTLKIYNMLGEEVRTLVDVYQEAGSYEVRWDGRDELGARVPSGMYIYRLRGADAVQVRKMILLQ